MVTQLTINRTVQRALAIQAWLNAKSETFTAMCGEEFTHKEVLLANIGAVIFFIILGVAGKLEGGAL
jgi:hypothetical protein